MNVNSPSGQGDSPSRKNDMYGSMVQMPIVNEK